MDATQNQRLPKRSTQVMVVVFLSWMCFIRTNAQIASDTIILSRANNSELVSAYTVTQTPYRFMAAGHWYGAHENYRSVSPAASLLQAVQRINSHHPDMTFSLGDWVRDASDSSQWKNVKNLAQKIDGPTLYVPGNHDLNFAGDAPAILERQSPCFVYSGDLFILLNTEDLLHHRGINILKQLQNTSNQCESARNTFVFSHRLIWALTEPGFEEMDEFANEPLAPFVNLDTLDLIYKEVLQIAGTKPLYWFSGDIGASWSLNAFEGHSADGHRHFYAAGLGDCAEDAFWEVDVDADGNVQPSIFWLDVYHQPRSEVYDLAYWRKEMTSRERENRQRVALSTKQWISKNWQGILIGMVLGVVLVMLLIGLIRRKKQH